MALSKTGKASAAARARLWRKRNPEQSKAYSMAWYRKHGNTPKAQTARRRYHLKKTYGLSLEEYNELFVAQGGVCAICKLPETLIRSGSYKSLDVDHNHETGKVRGLLCGSCNGALGLLREDIERILAMLDYVVEHNGD